MEEKAHGAWDKAHETEKGHWEEAYASATYRQMVRLRYRFVVPAIIVFCILFFILFTLQHCCKSLAISMVFQNMNVNFLYTMLLFPVLWLAGLIFLRYVRQHVYPLETEINEKYRKQK